MDFRKDQHPIHCNFKGPVSRECHNLIRTLVQVSVQSQGQIGEIVLLDIMLRGFVLGDGGVSKHGSDLGLELIVELVVLGLIVPGAPVVEMAVYAVFNLDMHRNDNFIFVTNMQHQYYMFQASIIHILAPISS